MRVEGGRPSRGEIWLIGLQRAAKSDGNTQRTALVLSVNELNHGPAELAIVAPISERDYRIATHVPVAQSPSTTSTRSYVLCEDLRSVSTRRFLERLGVVDEQTMRDVIYTVSVLLGHA
ncbi:MAG: type II toxin-antitoxin system PemK/MazF family toxin [Gemmatimonadaceae bacterium]